jgi:hypothetical protein
MAVIIRAHGYPDGNGRIARVAYAISLLRGLEPVPTAAAAKTTWIQEGHGRYKKDVQGGAKPASRFRAPTPQCTGVLIQM